tara:strand:- start:185 stop:586 length:402 start_codon:yes stop_codon:yes gene_type:complete
MSVLRIESLLYIKAEALGYEIAPENIPFEKSGKTPVWIEFYHMPNISDELDKNGRIERLGIAQLSLFALTDTGRGDILSATDRALASFKSGTEINDIALGLKIIINQCNIGQSTTDDNFYRTDLTIQYRAFYG